MMNHSHYMKSLVVGVLSVNLFVYTILGLSIRQSYLHYESRAETTTHNLADLLNEEIIGDIEKLDVALLSAVDEVERQIASGGIKESALNIYLKRLHERLDEAMSLRVTDATGMVKYGTGVTPNTRVNAADREYFTRQRDGAKAGLVIDKPLLSTIDNNKWTFPISRRINRPDGSFAGVVYLNVAFEHFSMTFSKLNVGQRGSIALRDDQLGLVIRYPELKAAGLNVGSKAVSSELQAFIQRGHATVDPSVKTIMHRV